MLIFATRRTLHIWIAILAILFSALAPSVSHALAAAAGANELVQVCTVDGYKTVQLSAGHGTKSPDSAMHAMEHCAFCATHGGSFALLPSSAATFAVSGGHDLYPSLFYNAPRALHIWSAARPRGPPSFV